MSDAELHARNLDAVMTMAANGILGNWDIVRPFVADDIVLRVPETLPWGGERHGWAGYQEALTIMTAFFADITVSDVTFTPVEDKVIIRMIIGARVVPTGRPSPCRCSRSGRCATGRSARSPPSSSIQRCSSTHRSPRYRHCDPGGCRGKQSRVQRTTLDCFGT